MKMQICDPFHSKEMDCGEQEHGAEKSYLIRFHGPFRMCYGTICAMNRMQSS